MVFTVFASVVLVVYIARRIFQANAKADIPRVGNPGLIGYILTAFTYTLNSEKVLKEGWDKFSGRPFIQPTLGGSRIVLGPKHVEYLRKNDDTIFSQAIGAKEALQFNYTLNEQQWKNTYHANVVNTDVTRAIPSFIPDILEETELTVRNIFNPSMDSKPVQLAIFDTMTYMIARISNRAILGIELCRNEEFIHAVIAFAKNLVLYAWILRCMPQLVRPIVYFVLSSLFGGQKQPKKFILPYVKQRLRQRETQQDTSGTMAEFLIRKSGQEKVEDLAVRVLTLNFASIHTTTIILCQALFELAVMPKSDLELMRTEVIEALHIEGGWNKPALARFRMIDSLLRETARFHGITYLLVSRQLIRDTELTDGTRISAGSTVVVYSNPVHFNPEIYPEPQVFDAFRFSRVSDAEGNRTTPGFATLDNSYLLFGTGSSLTPVGRHACPGRSFAAMELKIMIAHLLLTYEISLPVGMTVRPKNITFDGANLPDPKAELVFTRRSGPGSNG